MNSNKKWELRIREKIWKDIKKFPEKAREKLILVIENLPINPYLGNIQKIKNQENIWRKRFGVYRIFYEIVSNDKVIYVFRIERRTSKTYH